MFQNRLWFQLNLLYQFLDVFLIFSQNILEWNLNPIFEGDTVIRVDTRLDCLFQGVRDFYWLVRKWKNQKRIKPIVLDHLIVKLAAFIQIQEQHY